jgi:glycosyltransferase involved in cell wall biosynthesis
MPRRSNRDGADKREYDYVVALNYYAPHISGLSDMAKRIAEEMVKAGLKVCVVCQRHDKSLMKFETINGVDVVRASVIMRVANGLISASFPFLVFRYAKRTPLLHLHLPMLEAGLISIISTTSKLVTYQCDFVSQKSLLGRIIEVVMDMSCRLSIKRSTHSVVSSRDYADNSRVKSSLVRSVAIAPPMQIRQPSKPSFRKSSGYHYGFLGRIAPEKGLENLVTAFSSMGRAEDQLLIAGTAVSSEGQEIYKKLQVSSAQDPRIGLMGFVPESDVADFYASIDAFVFPSINALEAFGIAQAEAKALGIPLVTSDLPGVRTVVDSPETGVLVKPDDVTALKTGMENVRMITRKLPQANSISGLQKYQELILELLKQNLKN